MGRTRKIPEQLVKLPLHRIAFDAATYPRDHDGQEIAELAEALHKDGLRQPILVRDLIADDSPRLVVGACRLLAARELGWGEMDCLVLGEPFRREIGVIEQLQRGEFNPWELADAILELKKRLRWSQADLGNAIGRSRDFTADLLVIAQIAPEARQEIVSHRRGHTLSLRHLRFIARNPASGQLETARRILKENLSTTTLEHNRKATGAKQRTERIFKVRPLRKRGTPLFPGSAKEWRRYTRQLHTDLKGITRREKAENKSSKEMIAEARLRQRLVRKEANKLRRELNRELKQALKQLARLGEL